MKINKLVLTGVLVGIISTCLGSFLYILILSSHSVTQTIKLAIANNTLSKILTLGSLLNLLPFFYFFKINKDDSAKGVLITTILLAIFFAISKLF